MRCGSRIPLPSSCSRSSGSSEAAAVLDGSRAVLVDDLKLQLEAGERELWLIEMHGLLEHRLAMVQVREDVENALREAK